MRVVPIRLMFAAVYLSGLSGCALVPGLPGHPGALPEIEYAPQDRPPPSGAPPGFMRINGVWVEAGPQTEMAASEPAARPPPFRVVQGDVLAPAVLRAPPVSEPSLIAADPAPTSAPPPIAAGLVVDDEAEVLLAISPQAKPMTEAAEQPFVDVPAPEKRRAPQNLLEALGALSPGAIPPALIDTSLAGLVAAQGPILFDPNAPVITHPDPGAFIELANAAGEDQSVQIRLPPGTAALSRARGDAVRAALVSAGMRDAQILISDDAVCCAGLHRPPLLLGESEAAHLRFLGPVAHVSLDDPEAAARSLARILPWMGGQADHPMLLVGHGPMGADHAGELAKLLSDARFGASALTVTHDASLPAERSVSVHVLPRPATP
jgi:hypothetical protein